MERIRFPWPDDENEATIKSMKSRIGPPKTNRRAARFAKKVMKNCFIEKGEASVLSA
jgi:tRNA nucleotidyltransferase (CCA-adding enzyme)